MATRWTAHCHMLPFAQRWKSEQMWTTKKEQSREEIFAVCPWIHVHTLSYQEHAAASLQVAQDVNWGRRAAQESPCRREECSAPASSVAPRAARAQGRERSCPEKGNEGGFPSRGSLPASCTLLSEHQEPWGSGAVPTLQPPLNSFCPEMTRFKNS